MPDHAGSMVIFAASQINPICTPERGAIQCRPGSPAMADAQCHGLAAPPVSFLPGQAGSSHPPVAYRVARLPVSPGQAA
jgi:hypothetical protein